MKSKFTVIDSVIQDEFTHNPYRKCAIRLVCLGVGVDEFREYVKSTVMLPSDIATNVENELRNMELNVTANGK